MELVRELGAVSRKVLHPEKEKMVSPMWPPPSSPPHAPPHPSMHPESGQSLRSTVSAGQSLAGRALPPWQLHMSPVACAVDLSPGGELSVFMVVGPSRGCGFRPLPLLGWAELEGRRSATHWGTPRPGVTFSFRWPSAGSGPSLY